MCGFVFFFNVFWNLLAGEISLGLTSARPWWITQAIFIMCFITKETRPASETGFILPIFIFGLLTFSFSWRIYDLYLLPMELTEPQVICAEFVVTRTWLLWQHPTSWLAVSCHLLLAKWWGLWHGNLFSLAILAWQSFFSLGPPLKSTIWETSKERHNRLSAANDVITSKWSLTT